MKIDPHPLRTTMIRPADELYRVDVTHQTQERLRSRSQRALPTSATTAGHPAWRWGMPVDRPSTTSSPVIFSPSDLEPGGRPQASTYGTPDEVRRRLQGR